jgi:hypothetical protein
MRLDECQIAASLIEGRIVKKKGPEGRFHLVLGVDYQLDKIHYRVTVALTRTLLVVRIQKG